MTASELSAASDALLPELAAVVAEAVNLDLAAEALDPDLPLYGSGLELDSIDILEIALVVGKRYGVQIKADDSENSQIFASLRALAQHIVRHRPA